MDAFVFSGSCQGIRNLWVPSTQQLFMVFVLLDGQCLFDNLYMESKVMQDQ
jgi:hypothetical protein